jgi:hypothetical protein
MKTAALIAALLLVAAPAAQPQKPPVTYPALAAVERSLDARFTKPGQDQPYDLLGTTRGAYLEGFGVVFTTELNLILVPVTPFNPPITKAEVAKVRERKLKKLEVLKQVMRESLAAAAASLGSLGPDEQIAYGVTFFYYSWEDKTGLPAQILMQAPKKALLTKGAPEAMAASIRVREF